jgi:hypothetical protein
MTEPPTDDESGFAAEEPEHCHDCYRLIRPGQGYFLTMELAALCPDCAETADAIRLVGGLTVEIQEDRLLAGLPWGPACCPTTRGSELHVSSVAG